jgi:4-hydroxymandelate oxidase
MMTAALSRTPSGSRPLEQARALAEGEISHAAWAYLMSAAGDGSAAVRNEQAFEELLLTPRLGRDVSNVHTGVTLFGQELEHPFIVAPMAMHALFDPRGEHATAAGASAAGAVFTASMESSVRWEDLPEGQMWCQISPQADPSVTQHLIANAQEAGAKAVVLTLDTPTAGPRYWQRDAMPAVPDHVSRPMLPGKNTRESAAFTWAGCDWDAIAEIAAASPLPVIGKGVMHPDDAVRCIDVGLAAIAVSNHGGRNLDAAPATASCLKSICTAVDKRVPILVDGGIRRGSAALAAIALGADAVMIGRPVIWGLGSQGEAGVTKVLQVLTEELRQAMALCGVTTLNQATPDLIHHA